MMILDYWFELTAGAVMLALIIYTAIISRHLRSYKKMTTFMQDGNIEEHVCKLEERLIEHQKLLKNLNRDIKAIDITLATFPHCWHLIRYNAFERTGSDLSFSLALLNDHFDGFILTSIFGREDSRVYAKPVVGGKSKYTLSEEEKQAIKAAMGKQTGKKRSPERGDVGEKD